MHLQFYIIINKIFTQLTLLSLCAYHLLAFTSAWIPKKVSHADIKYRHYRQLFKIASAIK